MDKNISFLNREKPLLTTMVMSKTPKRALEVIDGINKIGTDAFGIQIDQMPDEFHDKKTLKEIFGAMGKLPIYATNYRKKDRNTPDEVIAHQIIDIARCGILGREC